MRFSRLALAVVASGLLNSCAFSQWTEHYFFGGPGKRPVYENRVATGIAVLPLALVTDLVTFPIQGILLVIKGDDFLYKKSSYAAQSSNQLTQFSPLQMERIQLEARERMKSLDRADGEGATAFGINPDGSLVEVGLSAEALNQIQSRVRKENIYARDSLSSVCEVPGSHPRPAPSTSSGHGPSTGSGQGARFAGGEKG